MLQQIIKSIANRIPRNRHSAFALSLNTQSQPVIATIIEITRLTLADGKEIDFKHRENAIAWIIINASIGGQTPVDIQTVRVPYLEVMR